MAAPRRSISRTLTAYGVGAVGFADGVDEASMRAAAATAEGKGRVSVIMIETPSNPLNTHGRHQAGGPHRRRDRIAAAAIVRSSCATTRCLGPSSSVRSPFGADVSVYSLTKYVGGHSDLIAGAALGSER